MRRCRRKSSLDRESGFVDHGRAPVGCLSQVEQMTVSVEVALREDVSSRTLEVACLPFDRRPSLTRLLKRLDVADRFGERSQAEALINAIYRTCDEMRLPT